MLGSSVVLIDREAPIAEKCPPDPRMLVERAINVFQPRNDQQLRCMDLFFKIHRGLIDLSISIMYEDEEQGGENFLNNQLINYNCYVLGLGIVTIAIDTDELDFSILVVIV